VKEFEVNSESTSLLKEADVSAPVSTDNIANVVAVIPAYNEERSLAKVLLLTQRHVDKVIVCDDGSMDMTAEIAERLGATVVRHEGNMGKGEALRTLFRETMRLDPDVVVTLDGDGQHDPDEIPELVKPIVAGKSDIVVGSRYIRGAKTDAPLHRRIGLRLINSLARKAANLSTNDIQSGFRAYSMKAVKEIASCEEKGFGIENEQLVVAAKRGLRVMEVPIRIRYRGLGKTSKKFFLFHGGELLATILRLVMEERPLLFLGVPGMALTMVGAGLVAYLLWTFNMTWSFSVPLAMVAFGMALIGLLFMMFAMVLFGLKKMADRLTKSLNQR